MNRSLVDSDEDQMELMENLMEKRNYDMSDEESDKKWFNDWMNFIVFIFLYKDLSFTKINLKK